MPPLRLALLGTGVAARKLYAPALTRARAHVRLVACANRTRSKAEAFAAETGCPKVVADARALFALPEVEAVLISLPIELQPAFVLKALAANKAVLSEKPVAPSLAAGRRLLKRHLDAKSPRTPVWMVAENYAFMPPLLWAERQIARRSLGDLRLVEVRQSGWTDASNPYFHTSWRRDARFVGGFVTDAGVHLAHCLRRLVGPPTGICGSTAQFNPELKPIDSAVAALRFANGALGTWMSCFSTGAGGPMLALRGALASLELYPQRCVLKTRGGKETVFESPADTYALQFARFAEAVQKNKNNPYPPEQALADLAVVEGVVRGRVLKP